MSLPVPTARSSIRSYRCHRNRLSLQRRTAHDSFGERSTRLFGHQVSDPHYVLLKFKSTAYMEYQASSQTDDNESIRIVCLRDRQQLTITNRHNVCFGTRQQLPAHHYNAGTVTSKQSRCATFKQLH